MDEIIRRIKIFEGYSAKPYICPAGRLTIGYGYNFEERGFKTEVLKEILDEGFSEELAEKLLLSDVQDCIRAAENVFGFYRELNAPRRAVVTDMIYQMGLEGFKKFKRMIAAIQKGDFAKAADEMKDSKWYVQSGRRSLINTRQMLEGEYQEVL